MRLLDHTRHGALLAAALLALTACGDDDDGPTDPPGPQPFLGCSTVQTIAAGANINGELATTDCQAPRGSYVDYYELRLTAQRTVTLTMRSNSVDSFLAVLTRQGQLVAENDDMSDATFDAQIVRQLAAGTYVVAATSFEVGEVGPYTLTLAAQ